jgi:hypothetical protein
MRASRADTRAEISASAARASEALGDAIAFGGKEAKEVSRIKRIR